jgi:hypothetical protein
MINVGERESQMTDVREYELDQETLDKLDAYIIDNEVPEVPPEDERWIGSSVCLMTSVSTIPVALRDNKKRVRELKGGEK